MIGSRDGEFGFKHCAQLWTCATDYRNTSILFVSCCKVYAQGSRALCFKSFEVLGPFNQRDATGLTFINDSRA